jgi:YD repeat-containing protein
MLPISSIEIQNQILKTVVGINGTPFSLYYSSDRTSGRQAAYTRNILVSGSHIANGLERIEITITISDRQFVYDFPPEPNQSFSFTWDGKDANGNLLNGKQPATIRTNYFYPPPECHQFKESKTSFGAWDARVLGLGGWSLNINHSYDVAGNTLYLGNGQRRSNITTIKTEFSQGNEILEILSESGSQLYLFDTSGRHISTFSTLTKTLLYQFDYNRMGYLQTMTDGDNNITRLEYDADGNTVNITAPYGQRTRLNLDLAGYLASIINPAHEISQFTYKNGLLTSFTDAKGNIYQFEYDELGRLRSSQEPDGSFELLKRTRTEKGFQVAKITATGRESTYLTERLSGGEERQVNKGCGGAGAIVAVTGKDGTETITYPDGSIFIQEQQADPRWGKQVPMVNPL